MILIVGVHGPIQATYIVIEDRKTTGMHFTACLFVLLKKMMSTAEKATWQGEGLISVPPASFQGRPRSRFTHFRSLRVSSVTLNP